MPRHPSPITHHGFFVTGTDTGVGKTLVSCALLKAFVASGKRAVGMKPVAAGAEPSVNGLVNDDVENLISAGNVAAPREHVNPYCFQPAVAPHIAAEAAGVEIRLGRIRDSLATLSALADVVVVEGAGGFRVPLGASLDTAGLVAQLGLPVILVVGMRLGCLNHALLTAEAIAARGLVFAGWVANHIDSHMAVAEENVRTLKSRLPAPLLMRIAFQASPNPAEVATRLDTASLR